MPNEASTPETASGNQTSETLRSTLAEVANRHQAEAAAVNAGPNQNPAGIGLDNGSLQWVGRCSKAVFRSFESWACGKIYRKAIAAIGDKEIARNVVAESVATEDQLAVIDELSVVLARKYNLDTRYAPEVALGCVLGSIALQWHFNLSKLETMAAQRLAETAKNQTNETIKT